MPMSNPQHPIWKTLHLAVVAVVLWLNASNFDETEIKAIVQMALISGAIEWGRSKAGG